MGQAWSKGQRGARRGLGAAELLPSSRKAHQGLPRALHRWELCIQPLVAHPATCQDGARDAVVSGQSTHPQSPERIESFWSPLLWGFGVLAARSRALGHFLCPHGGIKHSPGRIRGGSVPVIPTQRHPPRAGPVPRPSAVINTPAINTLQVRYPQQAAQDAGQRSLNQLTPSSACRGEGRSRPRGGDCQRRSEERVTGQSAAAPRCPLALNETRGQLPELPSVRALLSSLSILPRPQEGERRGRERPEGPSASTACGEGSGAHAPGPALPVVHLLPSCQAHGEHKAECEAQMRATQHGAISPKPHRS